MAEQNLNIYQKLAKIRKQVEVIQRNKNDADYILWNGNRPQIKRKKFEEYIDRHNLI